jgi:hypothetical protein
MSLVGLWPGKARWGQVRWGRARFGLEHLPPVERRRQRFWVRLGEVRQGVIRLGQVRVTEGGRSRFRLRSPQSSRIKATKKTSLIPPVEGWRGRALLFRSLYLH